MRFKVSVILFILFTFNAIWAQEIGDAGQPGEFLRYGVGGRALAMGGAYGAIAYDATAPIWNPSGLGYINHIEFTFLKNKLRFDNDLYYLGFVVPFKLGSRFKFATGLGWASLLTIGYEERDQYSNIIGKFNESQNVYLGSTAFQLDVSPIIINMGLNIKWISHSVELAKTDYKVGDKGFDWGLLFSLTPLKFKFFQDNAWINLYLITPLRFGIYVQNSHQPYLKSPDKEGDIYPITKKYCFGYVRERIAGSVLGFTFTFDYINLNKTKRDAYWNVGAEIKCSHPKNYFNINLRFGVRDISKFDALTTGVGFEFSPYKLLNILQEKWTLSFDPYYRFNESAFFNQTEAGFSSNISYDSIINLRRESKPEESVEIIEKNSIDNRNTMDSNSEKQLKKTAKPIIEIIDKKFTDRKNHNGKLNGDEYGEVEVKVTNAGQEDVENMTVCLSLQDSSRYSQFLEFDSYEKLVQFKADSIEIFTYQIYAKSDVPKIELFFDILVKDNNNSIISKDTLKIVTDTKIQPKLKIETTFNDKNGNGNNKINYEELINITIKIVNEGNGIAEDIKAILNVVDTSNIKIYMKKNFKVDSVIANSYNRNHFELGNIEPDSSSFINFMIFIKREYSRNGILPIEVQIIERRKEYTLDWQNLNLILEGGQGPRGHFFTKIKEKAKKFIFSSSDVFVVIGIEKYRYYDDLSYAVSDAKTFKSFLLNNTGFKLYKELYDQYATIDSIRIIINNLTNDINSEGRIIFFFAGHGETRPAGAGGSQLGYFLPYEADPNNISYTAISMDEVKTWAKTFSARHVLFIFDACFSGLLGGSYRRDQDYNLDYLYENSGRHVITAGTETQSALEYNNLRHGVLTHFLLQGIMGDADKSPNDRVITLSELKPYLEDNVTNCTEGQQRPQIINLYLGEGELFFERIEYPK